MEINKTLFSRLAPDRKMELIDNMGINELMSLTAASISRIIKETGTRIGNTRNKDLFICRELRVSNNWNSEIEGFSYSKGKLFVMVYVQFSNTDRTLVVPLEKFLARGEYRGSIEWTDRNGGRQTSYFYYSEAQKARCIRRLLVQYLRNKYKEKLAA